MLLQAFEWHTPSHPPAPHETRSPTSHYARITRLIPSFTELGVTALWLPPGCKGNYANGNGYDCYDLWDLGEFEQKWGRSTKWGSREELQDLIESAKECGIELVWDAVLNHKTAGDSLDECWAVEVDRGDRRYEICPPRKIQAWLRFDFPGRQREGMRYSNFKWRAEHFNGTDWDQKTERSAIYKLIDDPATQPLPQVGRRQRLSLNGLLANGFGSTRLAKGVKSLSKLLDRSDRLSSNSSARGRLIKRQGKEWAEDVNGDHGNNDYLMFANVDYRHLEVQQDVLKWGEWMVNNVQIDGFRLDAAQHFSSAFTKTLIQRVQQARINRDGQDAFVVGEVWTTDVLRLLDWLDAVQPEDGPEVHAYDSTLVYNFSRISQDVSHSSLNSDLRTITRQTLLDARPQAAITLVTNHDTQAGQASYTPILPSLKALFYAFILLRTQGHPCVFWGDLFGTQGPKGEPPACLVNDQSDEREQRSLLPDLMLCRKLYAHGEQHDYWSSASCIGWTRAGTQQRPGCAVIMNIEHPQPSPASLTMAVGQPGQIWTDVLGTTCEEVLISDSGEGVFSRQGPGVSVFVDRDAPGRSDFPVAFDSSVGS